MKLIRQQLTRTLVGTMLVLVVVSIAALYWAARDAATDQFDHALQAKALAISTLVLPTEEGLRVDFSDRFFHGFEDSKPRDFFELWDADGQVVTRSESLGATTDLPIVAGTADKPKIWNLTLPTDRAGRAIGFTFKAKARDRRLKGHEPTLRLVVASDRDDLDETLWSLVAIAGACGVLLVATTLATIPRVLRRGLRPVEALSQQATGIDAGTLHLRFETDELPAELKPIAVRLNDLLGRLEASFERERRFSADLAHELRTPLAELRSLAECALKWPESRDPATDRETLAIAEQMQRLVGFILALARAENGETSVTVETVAVDSLVREAWRTFAASAAEKQIDVTFDVAPVTARADVALLRSIIVNLFDNAVEYTPRNGKILTRVQSTGGRAVMAVTNHAPELDEADIANLFDRFWRKEAARSGGKHVGLGLSLARGFAETMGWTLTAQRSGEGVTFFLTGPLDPAPQPQPTTAERPVSST